ncbi:hypothetical protein [Paramicrobacterium humi]|uniref:hypothetical protein n=1 Tax=Paramicrobacterium humi TaxID=640635 RepID=UPI000B869160|nr:hypothetical protein [Microbacterium humi]
MSRVDEGGHELTSGVWRVRTRSGARYLLDLDRHVLVRERGLTSFSAPLRRDGDEAILHAVVGCEVGKRMLLLIDLSWPGVTWTRRLTTPVVSIEQIGDGDDLEA